VLAKDHIPVMQKFAESAAPAITRPAETGADTGEVPFATAELEVGGMHCSACAVRIERMLGRLPAVASASVNLATARAFISYDESAISAGELCRTVADAGYTAEPASSAGPADRRGDDNWVLRAVIAWPLAIAALGVSLLLPQTAGPGWAVLVLGLLAEFGGGWPFLRNAGRLLRHGGVSMDTLAAFGTLAAIGVQAVEVVATGGSHIHIGGGGAFAARLHYAMAPLIVAIFVTGRAAEASGRRRAAGAMHSLLSLRPPTARVVPDPGSEHGDLVAPESVPAGALVRVAPHEAIPLDGTVVQGWSAVDESMLTGEPLPADRGPGSRVTGGTRNGSGTLVVRVEALASESVLTRLQRLVDEAQRGKAPVQRLADRVSRVFVPAVLLFAAGTFAVWWFGRGGHDTAVLAALSVLLVACPCAMGLAAPVAMMVGCGTASALGIFIRDGDALERLSRVDTVVFDKTGTLTERHAVVTGVITAPGISRDELLATAAAVEAGSDHPIAAAILAAAGRPATGRPATGRPATSRHAGSPPAAGRPTSGRPASGPPVYASDVRVIPGAGVSGTVGGLPVRVTRLEQARLPASLAGPVAAAQARGETAVLAERGDEVLGAITLTTPLRPEARPSIRRLREMGIATAVLSGDSEPAVATAAATLGISDVRAALSPAGKVAALRAGHLAARTVMMVGDGVNDTPALAAASIGCAIGSGSEAALATSDVALLGNDLNAVPAAITLAQATYQVMLQNFGWAAGYNIAALPLAAAGLIDPLVAAAAMALSSLLVVANSLRLARLGRSGPAGVRGTRIMHGARGIGLSVMLPVILFAALTAAGQAASPARGQSLLPRLPAITTVSLAGGGSAQVYLDSGAPGVNELHVFIYPPHAHPAIGGVAVTAALGDRPPQLLRHLEIAPGHYLNYVLLTPGKWTFHVSVQVSGRAESFTIDRTIP
jgi:heavy metal translocating P-type ATPase